MALVVMPIAVMAVALALGDDGAHHSCRDESEQHSEYQPA
jgi:hypothetical protein